MRAMTDPEPTVPDVRDPDPAVPDERDPDLAVPDVTDPEPTVPDVRDPDPAVPDVPTPDLAVTDPDLAVPDVPDPDPAVPDVRDPSPPLTGTRTPSRRGRARFARLAVAVAVVLAASVSAVWIRGDVAHPSAAGPSATVASVPTTTAGPTAAAGPTTAAVATPLLSPTPVPSQDLAAEVAAVEAQVPPLRQLEPLRTVPTRIIDPAQLRQSLEQQLDAPDTAAAMAAEQDLLVRLGLASPGLDLRALSLATLSSQVLGLYDPATHSMTIVNRIGDFGLTARFTVAHEYTHALQDQHFDFAKLGANDSFPTDRVLALHALIEGDATLLSGLWMQAHISLSDLLDLGQLLLQSLQPPVPPGTPALVSRTLLFPYLDGLSFVTALYQQGGWAAVDQAYARPPGSTSEILHPDRYLAGWHPTPVVAPALGKTLGSGWTRTYLDTMGELTFQVWLAQALPTADATGLAADWLGDQVVEWNGPAGAWVIAWRSTWATAGDADAFATAAGRLLGASQGAGGAGPHLESVSGRTVTLLVASDQPTLDRVSRAAGR